MSFETGSQIHEGMRQAYNLMADTVHSKQALTSMKERDKHTLHGRYGPFKTGSHIHEGTRQAYNSMADTAHSKQALTSMKE